MKKEKAFNVRVPKELWAFLKTKSIEKNTSMNGLIIKWLEKWKEKDDKNS